MVDIPWSEFARVVGEEGGLPDGVVDYTNLSDWEAVVKLVRERAARYVFSSDGVETELPGSGAPLFDAERHTLLQVWLDAGVQVNFFPRTPDSIYFDVDARELTTHAAVDALLSFVADLGFACGKPVRITAEGADDVTLLAFDPRLHRFTLSGR